MIIEKLKSEKFTFQENLIVNYIFSHPSDILNMRITELAAATYTSSSCVTRLCKKVGVKSFPDFKVQFALEYANYSGSLNSNGVLLGGEAGTVEKINSMLKEMYSSSYFDTINNMDVDTINEVVDHLVNDSRIDVYGTGNNYYTAQQFCFNLQTLGVNAYAYQLSNEDYLIRQSKQNVKVYSIVISHGGTNQNMIMIASRLKKLGMSVLGLIGRRDTPLEQFCDKVIFFASKGIAMDLYPIRENISIYYITDILFTQTLLQKYKNNHKNE